MKDLKLINNKKIDKDMIADRIERNFNKRIDKVPKRKSRLLAIIFKEDKGAKFIWVSDKQSINKEDIEFHHKGHLYFFNPNNIYISDNNNRCVFFLEGISTPLGHNNIEKEIVTKTYTDIDGTKKDVKLIKIKGLKYDSRILDIFTDRKLAEIFTRIQMDKWAFYTFIFLCVLIGLSVANIGCAYYFK